MADHCASIDSVKQTECARDQILVGVIRSEIAIAIEVIQKNAGPVQDQANAVGQIVEIFRREKGTPDVEIPLQNRSAQLEIKRHLIGRHCFSPSRLQPERRRLNVVVDKPWFHGVEINQADCLTVDFIDHHVVDLGVLVNRSTIHLIRRPFRTSRPCLRAFTNRQLRSVGRLCWGSRSP